MRVYCPGCDRFVGWVFGRPPRCRECLIAESRRMLFSLVDTETYENRVTRAADAEEVLDALLVELRLLNQRATQLEEALREALGSLGAIRTESEHEARPHVVAGIAKDTAGYLTAVLRTSGVLGGVADTPGGKA